MDFKATYEITTPMFMHGIEGPEFELRVTSLRGIFRFWFRAMALPMYGSIEHVYRLEKKVFGSTEEQSSVLFSIDDINGIVPSNSKQRWNRGKVYLANVGHANKPNIKSGGQFTLRVKVKPEKEDVIKEVKFLNLFEIVGLLGGVGARNRKGFGSLTLKSLKINDEEKWINPPKNRDELAKRISSLLLKIGVNKAGSSEGSNELSKSLPQYTAFSNHTRIWIAKTGSEAENLLDHIGEELLQYRKPKYNKCFKKDPQIVLKVGNNESIDDLPRRAIFGLPHNYYFKDKSLNASVKPAIEYNRRASPLFIHIHSLGERSYAAVLTLLPAQFLPENKDSLRVEVWKGKDKINTKSKTVNNSNKILCYKDIAGFLDSAAFKDKVVVWP